MSLGLFIATTQDAPRIAEIHMAAFGSNPLLRAQFPNSAIRNALQKSIERKALADIRDPDISVLVVRVLDGEKLRGLDREGRLSHILEMEDEGERNGTVISFSKWNHPVREGEDFFETPWVWPEGTEMEVLESWTKKMEEVQERLLGQTPCYRLSFMGTDPHYERRGAASLMLRWGVKECRMNNAPARLESTLEAAPLYRNNEFVDVEKVSMEIGVVEDGEEAKLYSEICLVFRP